eukprot:9225502-Ditylum_brightwellii.AAC.1
MDDKEGKRGIDCQTNCGMVLPSANALEGDTGYHHGNLTPHVSTNEENDICDLKGEAACADVKEGKRGGYHHGSLTPHASTNEENDSCDLKEEAVCADDKEGKRGGDEGYHGNLTPHSSTDGVNGYQGNITPCCITNGATGSSLIWSGVVAPKFFGPCNCRCCNKVENGSRISVIRQTRHNNLGFIFMPKITVQKLVSNEELNEYH